MGREPAQHRGERAVSEERDDVAREEHDVELLLEAQVQRCEVGHDEAGVVVLVRQRDEVGVRVDTDRHVAESGQLARHSAEAAPGVEDA